MKDPRLTSIDAARVKLADDQGSAHIEEEHHNFRPPIQGRQVKRRPTLPIPYVDVRACRRVLPPAFLKNADVLGR